VNLDFAVKRYIGLLSQRNLSAFGIGIAIELFKARIPLYLKQGKYLTKPIVNNNKKFNNECGSVNFTITTSMGRLVSPKVRKSSRDSWRSE
jgi:hypothetical protein